MRFRATETAGAVGGRLVGPDVEVEGVAIDSRLVRGRPLFVPITAERDGHRFVPDAVAEGAPAYLSAEGALEIPATCIEVAHTGAALLDIGRLARRRLPDRVVGVTGSVGKTTVKDLAAAALAMRYATAASERSFNNELGVPLTLANAPDGAEAVVVEMGARGLGQIALLCGVARPTIGVVTVVAAAHTALFGSIEDVAEAKGELVEALPASGTAVLNAGDPRVLAMKSRTAARCLTFSTAGGSPADITAEDVHVDDTLRPAFRLASPWGVTAVRLSARGVHNVANALAAAGAALVAGVALEEVAEGLGSAVGSPSRMQVGRSPSGLIVIDDAYNANPTSMEAALRALATVPAGRRLAVLGIMAELGPESGDEHRRIGALARSLGIEVLAVDAPDYGAGTVAGAEAVLAALADRGPLGPGDAVLVKASRVAGLERVAAALLAGGPGGTGGPGGPTAAEGAAGST